MAEGGLRAGSCRIGQAGLETSWSDRQTRTVSEARARKPNTVTQWPPAADSSAASRIPLRGDLASWRAANGRSPG